MYRFFNAASSPLGEGAFGKVVKATWNGAVVAVKQLHARNLELRELEMFMREAELYHRLQHPNIVQMYGVAKEANNYAIVMEFMPQGDLHNKIYNAQAPLRIQEKLNFTRDILLGLRYLHKQDIIHRDLKPKNVLIKEGQAKLADFGIAVVKNATTRTATAFKLWENVCANPAHNRLAFIPNIGDQSAIAPAEPNSKYVRFDSTL